MLGIRHTYNTAYSRISAIKEMLQIAKAAAGAIPLVGSPLQALFETAEIIVDRVEELKHEKDAAVDLAEKVCEIVIAIGYALEGLQDDENDTLMSDVSEVEVCAKNILDMLISKASKRKLSIADVLRFGTGSTSISDYSKCLDDKLKRFNFKSIIYMRRGLHTQLETLGRIEALLAVPETVESVRCNNRGRTVPDKQQSCSNKRMRSLSPSCSKSGRGPRTRLRLDVTNNVVDIDTCGLESMLLEDAFCGEDHSPMVSEDNVQHIPTRRNRVTKSGSDNQRMKRRKCRGRKTQLQNETHTNIGLNAIDSEHGKSGAFDIVPNPETVLFDCTNLISSTISAWSNRRLCSLPEGRSRCRAFEAVNVTNQNRELSSSTLERITMNEKRKAMYNPLALGNSKIPEDTPDVKVLLAQIIDTETQT